MITLATMAVPLSRPVLLKGETLGARLNRSAGLSANTAFLQNEPNFSNLIQTPPAPLNSRAISITSSQDLLSSSNSATAVEPTSQPSSFESILAASLTLHAEPDLSAAPVVLARNLKPQISPGPEPHKPPRAEAIDFAVLVPVKPIRHEALPLVFNVSLPLAAPDAKGRDFAVQNNSLAAPPKPDIAPKLTLSGETAFTARVVAPDQPPFVMPSTNPESNAPEPNAPISAPAAEAMSSVSKASAVSKPVSPGFAAPEITNTVQAAVEPASSVLAGNAISKEPALVKTVSPMAETSDAPTVAPAPLKEIAFQLPGTRGVEVKLTETAGQVRVDVRSVDPALTQDLRGNLHELVNALEKKGLSAEITHPVDGTSLRTSDLGGARNSSDNPGDSPGRQHQERQQQERGQQERQRQQQSWDDRPPKQRATAWNDAFDSDLENSHPGTL